MADWNNPQTGQTYTSHFESIRDKDNALAKMFDGTSETNLPDGAIKINSGSKYRIEKWDASASSWNTVIPGLGDLTQAEVDVLDGLTASTSELNKLDGLTATTTELNQIAEIGSTTISSTQWGYLGGLGSAPLEDDDLAANGGTVPEVDQNEVITGKWRVEGSAPSLDFSEDDLTDQNFRIVLQNGALRFENREDSLAFQSLHSSFEHKGGFTVGGATDQGSGTINAEALYDNGNRVYSESNAPASTDLSDHESQVVELGGDFDAGEEVRCERIGNLVTIMGIGSSLSASGNNGTAHSAHDVIPSGFRPSNRMPNLYTFDGVWVYEVEIDSTNNTLSVRKRDWSSGNIADVTSTFRPPVISYLIT